MTSKDLRLARLLAIALMPMIVAGCSTVDVGSDYDRQASFANYHTFMIVQRRHSGFPNPVGLPNLPGLPNPPGGNAAGVSNPLVAQRVQEDILQELTRKGYQQVNNPMAADLIVDFTIGAQDRLNISSYPGFGPGRWDSGLDVRQVHEGTLSIDIFDTRTHRAVWYGWAKKDLSRKDMEQSEQPVRDAVAAMLAKFPPQ